MDDVLAGQGNIPGPVVAFVSAGAFSTVSSPDNRRNEIVKLCHILSFSFAARIYNCFSV
jgi:hypothetical protein